MSKKMKKLLCGLLAFAMLSTSGIAALADEPAATAAAEVTATASPEAATEAPAQETAQVATEAPAEPTAEPTAAPGKYENDSYYNKALALCTSLGVITGYEDGSVKPESSVTRAEMSAIILRLINMKSTTTYRNIFTDVNTSHWACDTIQTVSDEGVVNGMGDGTFNPDGDVLYEQAVKMIVCAMNYQNEAELAGGYPNGYLAVAANNLSLLDSVKGSLGTAADRGTIIKMAYNALIGPYNEISSYDQGNPVYSSDKTLAKAKFDVIEAKGLLEATHTTSLTSTKPAEGQVIIDGETYTCSLGNVDDYLANKITYYYVDDNKADPNVIAILTDVSKTKVDEVAADDIDTVTDLGKTAGTVKTYSKKSYKTNDAYIIYNGEAVTESEYLSAAASDSTRFAVRNYDGVSTGQTKTFDQFLTPDSGSIKLVDNDNDGKYDVVFVTAAENMVITAATDKKVSGKVNNEGVTLDVDNDAQDKTITVTLEGTEAKTKNLKKNDVVSMTRNLNQDILTFETTGEAVTGTVASIATGNTDDPATAKINGVEYIVDANAYADCSSGINGTFYLDKYNRIGYVDSDSVISSSEKYGWITTAYLDDSGDDYKIKLYTQDGKIQEFNLANSVSYWAPNATTASSYTKSDMQKQLANISYNQVSGMSVDIRLVKYGTNASGEINKLYCAASVPSGYKKGTEYSSTSQTYDKKGLNMSTTNMTGNSSVGNLLGSTFYMSDNMLEFVVPNTNSEMGNSSNYRVGTTKASAYLDKENGISKDCIFGEFSDDNQTYPTVVVRFEGATTNAALSSDYGTADNNPSIVVKKILTGVDDDNETVYTIVGYQNGGEVRYTTRQNTLLTKVSGLFNDKVSNSGRNYESTDLWNAVDGITASGKSLYPGATELTDFIGVGDIIGVADNGKVLMLMVDASELAEGVLSGNIPKLYNSQNPGISSSRDSLYIGMVADSDIGQEAVMSVAEYKCMFDTTRAMDTVTINSDGDITLSTENSSTIADVEDFDAKTNTGDFAFVRYANKGSLQEIYLFRFED